MLFIRANYLRSYPPGMRNSVKVAIAAAVILILIGSLSYYVLGTTYTAKPEVSQYTTEYQAIKATSEPNAIAVDSQGNVFFTLMNDSSLAELNPSTGKIQQFPIPGVKGGTTSWGMTVDNTRGLVWFTEETSNSIWSFNISTHKFTRYELPSENAFPFGIAVGQNGDVWFTEFFDNNIGEITPSGNLTQIPIPLSGLLEASSITVDQTGKVWFTLPGIDFIGSYYDGEFAFKNLTGLAELPVGIAVDSQGNLWLTQHGPSFIAEYNPTTDYFESISTSIPTVASVAEIDQTTLPYFDYVDQNGDVWFNEHYGNAMAEFIPSNNTLIEYYIPTKIGHGVGNISGMLTSTLSPSGQPWYTELFAGKVGTINTQAPLDLGLSLSNYTQPISLSPNGSVSIKLNITGSAASQATVEENVGNFTTGFEYSVSPSNQLITISGNSTAPGVYFVTISAVTTSLSYSQIIELEVQ